jgi:hypothetical protein
MGLDYPVDDRQPQACSAAASSVVHPVESIEDMGQMFRRDPDAVVLNRDFG